MSCEVCKLIIDGDAWRVEVEPSNIKHSAIAISHVMGACDLIIYPKPYKPHKFWGTTINHCPYCGADLKTRHKKSPNVIGVM